MPVTDHPSERDVERAMRLLPRLGEEMFAAGAETRAIKTSLVAVAERMGLRGLVVDQGGRSINLMYRCCHRPPYTVLQVNPVVQDRDLGRMCQVYRLIDDLVHGRVKPEESQRELRLRMQAAARTPWWARICGGGALAAAITLQSGAGLIGVLLGVVLRVLVDRTGWALDKNRFPAFYTATVQALLVNAFGLAAFQAGVGPLDVAALVSGNLLMLLPVLPVVSLTEDAIFGYPMTAAYRAIIVVRTLCAIVAGVAIVNAVDIGEHAFRQEAGHLSVVPLAVPLALLAAAVGGAGNVVQAGGWLMLIPLGLGGALLASGIRLVGLLVFHMPAPLAIMLAATALGAAGAWAGRRLRLPGTAIILPAVSGALLPSKYAASALVLYAAHKPGALDAFQEALVVTGAIGVGVVLGISIASHSDQS
ncbi:hypothetical protein GCM10027589_32890 [Actinocorallia lasiicapitis]